MMWVRILMGAAAMVVFVTVTIDDIVYRNWSAARFHVGEWKRRRIGE